MTEFYGYERPDGSVGVRNHLLVLAPIDCSYEPARRIAEQVDGAVAITQHHGCGLHWMVAHNLIGVASNPNVAAVLIFGLGCETLNADVIEEGLKPTGKPVERVIIQEEGGTLRAVEKGVRLLRGMAEEASEQRREAFPLSKLTLAVECGGSDATSGMAANPAVGVAADLLVDEGGTVIISEPQEMIGAEEHLARRAVSREVAEAIREMVARQVRRLEAMEVESRYMSRGNIEGGLTTIEEKSLGAVRKGGRRPIQGVLENSWNGLGRPRGGGLWLQDGTGWDIASVTHMVAAGAQVVAFTTGRGSTVGHAVAPVIKITGNPDTYRRMEDNIDINAGIIIEGGESIREVGERIFRFIVQVASGRRTKAELLGYRDFAVFKRDRAAERLLGFP
ncbi:MAG: carbohydrate hydrolase [Candidatus Bathyarchaeota archaeon B23]|nr:MAG: carbohydrate hydrolase [Candidatus Bathyarchaeota archaeon B23]